MKKIICLSIVLVILASSSYSCFAASGIRLWTGTSCTGNGTKVIPVGRHEIRDLETNYGYVNDSALSVSIPSGFNVSLFDTGTCGGSHWWLDRTDSNSNNFWNMSGFVKKCISSVIVARN
jgi:hypothetical protein